MGVTCFVIMPFGEKEDVRGVIIDFDLVYDDVIAPAIEAAAMRALRCDHISEGGWIHKDMITRIHDAEACVVDLTTLNPNVFYELGIRHALRRRVTVLLRQKGVNLPFNIQGLRTIEYDPSRPARAKQDIRNFLTNNRENDSLVHEVLPDLRIPPADKPIGVTQKILYEIVKCPNRKFGLITGDIREVQGVDVWVNSENTNMQMARFFDRSVCSVIRFLGARKDESKHVVEDVIADELDAIVQKKTVAPGTVVFTGAGELKDSHGVMGIMHVAAVAGQPGFGYSPVSHLDACVHNVLCEVDRIKALKDARSEALKDAKSIVFPLLGTGTARGDPKDLVPPQINAAVKYLENRPNTAIEMVWFLVYTTKHLEICTLALDHIKDRCRPLADIA